MSVKFYINLNRTVKPDPKSTESSENGLFFQGNNGRTVILVHGLTGTPYEVKFQAVALNRKGYTVICPRLANHGKHIDILKNTRWEAFYGSVRNAFVEAKQKDKNSVVFASGLSMGALLSLLLADEFKGQVAGVSCLSPTLFYDGWNMPWSRCLLPLAYRTPLKYFFYFKEDPPYGFKNKKMQDRMHKYYDQADIHDMTNVAEYGYPYFPVILLHQLNLLVKEVTRRLPKIEFPVQIMQAKDDDMTSIKNSQFIYDRIASKNKELVILNDSYHIITADQERDLVVNKMEEFFNNIWYNLTHTSGKQNG